MICENCGEELSSLVLAAADGGQVTCTICGVVQASFSQVVVEDYSGAYTQTQRVGRITSETLPVDAPREIDAYASIQMLLENVCKATIKAFALTNALEVEAKHYWRCYLMEMCRQSVQVDSIFSPSSDYMCDGEKLRAATRQFDNECDVHTTNPRISKVIKFMGNNAYDYCVELFGKEGEKGNVQDATLGCGDDDDDDDDNDDDNDNDDTNVNESTYDGQGSIEKHATTNAAPKPTSSPKSPIGVPLYLLRRELGYRQLPTSPSTSLAIGLKSAYRIIYMLQALYRHDFIWLVAFGFPRVSPLAEEMLKFLKSPVAATASTLGHRQKYLERIRASPLDMKFFRHLVTIFNIPVDLERIDVRKPAETKVLLLNTVFSFVLANFAGFTPVGNLHSTLLIPRLDLNLVCAILFLAMLACGMGIVANDVVRWIYLQRIPLVACAQMLPANVLEATHKQPKIGPRRRTSSHAQQELVSNVFSHANAPHSARLLKSTAARLIVSTRAGPVKFNCWSLVKRLIHISRLPDGLVYVVDLILTQLVEASNLHLAHEEENDNLSGYENPALETEYTKHEKMEADCIIYGEGWCGYPWHILGGAAVLVACRLAWPIFTLQPPAFPRDTLKRVPVTSDSSKRSDAHIDIQIQQGQNRVLWFDPGKFIWMLRIDTSHDIREEYIQTTCAGNAVDFKSEFQRVCDVINSGNKAIYMGTGLPDVCTPRESDDGTMLLAFDAKRDGYQSAGIRAFLWLMQLAPWHCKNVLKEYINDDILLTRRHVVDSLVQRGDMVLAFECALMPFIDYDKPIGVATFLRTLTVAFKDDITTRQILAWASSWSGSVLSILEDVIKKDKRDKHDPEKLQAEKRPTSTPSDVLASIQSILPNNNQIFYTLTTCFANDPLYSGWSIEKAMQHENFRRLVPNVRQQTMEMIRTHLNVEWCTRFATTPWTLVANQIESTCPIHIKETSVPTSTYSTGKVLGEKSRRIFQELPKHHKVYIPPKTSIGKHHNEMFNGQFLHVHGNDSSVEVPPVLYVVILKTISNAIGVDQESLHKCMVDVEQWLASTNNCIVNPTKKKLHT